jgi:hypothetical protein
VDELRMLGLTTPADELYKGSANCDVNLDRFCEIYDKKKAEKFKNELTALVVQSFEALG